MKCPWSLQYLCNVKRDIWQIISVLTHLVSQFRYRGSLVASWSCTATCRAQNGRGGADSPSLTWMILRLDDLEQMCLTIRFAVNCGLSCARKLRNGSYHYGMCAQKAQVSTTS